MVIVNFYPSPWDTPDLDIGDHAQAWENMRTILEGLGKEFHFQAMYTGTIGPDCYFEVTGADDEDLYMAFEGQSFVGGVSWDTIEILGKKYEHSLRVHVPIEKHVRRRRR